jgi:Flp pilus assembly protein TadD
MIIRPASAIVRRFACVAFLPVATAFLGACASPQGYGVDPRAAHNDETPAEQTSIAQQAKITPAVAERDQATYLNLIVQMQHDGQYFASLAHLDALEARFGKTPQSTLLRGDGQRMTEQPDAAAASYLALNETPLAGAGYRGQSLLAGARGDYKEACRLLEMSVHLNSTDPVALSDLGYARIRVGDLTGARIPLMTAAQLAPENPKILGNLALYMVMRGDTQGADAVMKNAKMTDATRRAVYAQAAQISGPAKAPVASSNTPLSNKDAVAARNDITERAPSPADRTSSHIDAGLAGALSTSLSSPIAITTR